MKVEIGTKTFYVGWKYENPQLNNMLEGIGLSEEEARKLTIPQLAEKLGVNIHEIPQPNVAYCILSNDQRVKVIEVSVKKHYKDKQSKEKARRYSLHKLLSTMFAGPQEKGTRAAFWDCYLARNTRKRTVETV